MSGRNAETVRFGPFRFVPGDGLWRGAEEMRLPPRALGVLTVLLARPGVVVSKGELLDAVWPDTFVTESSLLEAIGLLRDALGDDRRHPIYIQTVHRRGYRFVAGVTTGDEVPATASPSLPEVDGHEWRPLIVASAASVVATVAIAIVFAVFGQRPIEPRAGRFSIALPVDAPVDPLLGSIAVSNDGTRLVYVALASTGSRLYLRTIDRDEPRLIPGSEGATGPFLSPDGEWVGFFANGSLQKLRVTGGRPVTLCPARSGAGAVWSDSGEILFGGGPGGGLATVSDQGGDPVVVTAPAPGSRDIRYAFPDLLPGHRGVIFTVMTLSGSHVAVLDQPGGRRVTLAADAAFGRYSPTGHLIVERHGHLEAAAFSLASLTTTGAPRRIAAGLSATGLLDGPRFAFSRTGALVYVPGPDGEPDAPRHWLDTGEPMDGVADGGEGISPAWRPDGLEIAFAYSKAGPFNLFMKPADGHADPAPLVTSPWNQFPTSWTPDASQLAYTEFQPLTGADIWVLDVRTRLRRPVVRTLYDETWARFSPDGRIMAYMSNESGRWEIYVRDAAGTGPRLRVSAAGGVWPCWSADGRTLYFSANGRTMASAMGRAATMTASAPYPVPGADAMALAGGGPVSDRRLVLQADGRPRERRELRVVLGWFAELTHGVPVS